MTTRTANKFWLDNLEFEDSTFWQPHSTFSSKMEAKFGCITRVHVHWISTPLRERKIPRFDNRWSLETIREHSPRNMVVTVPRAKTKHGSSRWFLLSLVLCDWNRIVLGNVGFHHHRFLRCKTHTVPIRTYGSSSMTTALRGFTWYYIARIDNCSTPYRLLNPTNQVVYIVYSTENNVKLKFVQPQTISMFLNWHLCSFIVSSWSVDVDFCTPPILSVNSYIYTYICTRVSFL